MALRSKFLDILEKNKLIPESKFVKGREETKLPPDVDEEEEIDDEEEIDMDAPSVDPSEDETQGSEQATPQPIATEFTDREKDILNVAIQLYRNNPENPIEYKNDFSNMYQEGRYEELLGRLIAIADELID
jgi:hypothetical protein